MNKPVAGPPAPLDPEAADLADWHRYANDLVDAMVAEHEQTYTSFDVAGDLRNLIELASDTADKIVPLLNEPELRADPRVTDLGRRFAGDVAHCAALAERIFAGQRALAEGTAAPALPGALPT